MDNDRTIPKFEIEWLVGRMHVSTTDDEIKANIRKRCENPEWTEERIKEAEDYAVSVMQQHRKLMHDFRL